MSRAPMLPALLLAALCLATLVAADDPDKPAFAQELVTPYQIADARVQLERDGSNLAAYQDVDRFVEVFGACGDSVSKGIRAWLTRLALVASKREAAPGRVRVLVNVDEPTKGAVLVLYRVVSEKRLASLEILFDAIGRLEQAQTEQLVRRLELVVLKEDLKTRMECRQR